nr:unnamed protein product [Callosobruchus analis]
MWHNFQFVFIWFEDWDRRRPLSLAGLLNEIETINDVERIQDSIVVFPPDNANDPVTDEDSGEEENVVIDNMPGPQLRVECKFSKYDQQWDSDDKRPLSNFVKRRPKKIKKLRFSKQNLQSNLTTWVPVQTDQLLYFNIADVLQRMPYGPFHLFFDNYFTSLSLLKELGARNMKGTEFQNAHSNVYLIGRLRIGGPLVDDDIVICKWNDNRVVTLASNASAVFHYIMPKDFRNLKKKTCIYKSTIYH